MRFSPEEIRVAPGTTVVFVNADPMEHNVVQTTPAGLTARDYEGFRSPVLAPGEEFRYTFEDEGDFPILCDVGGHFLAGMVGSVTVTGDLEACRRSGGRIARSRSRVLHHAGRSVHRFAAGGASD